MVESQPGTVVSFNPSVTLAGFSSASRDKFMFNENQLVLAKIVRPLISYARSYGGTSSTILALYGGSSSSARIYDAYKNADGQFVYGDDQFFLSDATGVPVGKVVGTVIGFDFQVSTSQVKFWSTTFIDSTYLSMDYSFDNVTWFTVGTVTWSYVFDDTIEKYEGEFPASGQYVYTGNLASAATARYFRVKSQSIGIATAVSSTTITMSSTHGFPADGVGFTVDVTFQGNSTQSSLAYTNKTSTQITGITPNSTCKVGMAFVVDPDICPSLSNITEIRVLQTTEPILEHWNSDGSQAVSVVVEGSQYLDMCYDANDNAYYALYFNEEPTQTDPIDPNDNFDQAFEGANFDPLKWFESEDYPYFVHNTPSGTLDMVSAAGGGLLEGNYGIDGGYVGTIELVSVLSTTSGTSFCLASEEFDTGNQQVVIGIKGSYPGSGQFVGAYMQYSNTIGDAATLRDFKIKPQFFDFNKPAGYIDYNMVYNSSAGNYTVTVSGASAPAATPGVPYQHHNVAFTISNVYTPADGQGFTVHVPCSSTAIIGTATSGIVLEIERYGTEARAKYRDTDAPGTHTLVAGTVSSSIHRPYIIGHPGATAPIVRADNYTVTSGTITFDTPVFSVVAIDKDGNITTVPNVTDANGFAIKNFDIIRNPQATYNKYIYPYTGIATNGAAYNAGGEIYIKVGTTLYKYTKNTGLPLTHEDENASGASVVSTGQIPEDSITAFAYNGFSEAGLSYIKYEDSLAGVFLRTINTTDLTENAYKAKLDVASINFRFAWNVSDLSTLYYVNGTGLRLYDLNETKAAFVNVSSDKQVLAAGTAETAVITAQVLNVYGIPKSAKTMTFSVSAGDGAISPAIGCSNVSGEDTTTYTVGSAVGTATITVSVSDTTCTP